jgi:hypothetical protein
LVCQPVYDIYPKYEVADIKYGLGSNEKHWYHSLCKWLGLEEPVFNSSILSLLLTLARMCAIKDPLDQEEALSLKSKALPVCNVKTAPVHSTSSSVTTHSSDSSSYNHTGYGRC